MQSWLSGDLALAVITAIVILIVALWLNSKVNGARDDNFQLQSEINYLKQTCCAAPAPPNPGPGPGPSHS